MFLVVCYPTHNHTTGAISAVILLYWIARSIYFWDENWKPPAQ